jgi:MerR family transcriptional regulator, mercuric resistance operon regulatory protein
MADRSSGAKGLLIGELAGQAGVNVETIRYYQRIGLLTVPERAVRGVRRYSGDDLNRVKFIKRAQALGFSLEEIELLLHLSDGRHCAETRELAEVKLGMVEKKLGDLAGMRKALKKLVLECSRDSRGRGCPIIEALSGPED